jgi:hypothetical protein
MSDSGCFLVFVLVSAAAFAGILASVTRTRQSPINWRTVAGMTGVVVISGMVFARVGAQAGWPVGVYYGLPALVTWVVPPLALRMNRAETARYLPLVLIMAPAIHVLFSFFLGWNEYMPFIPVPSLSSLI